ncbi:transposase [Streptomyces sp. NPDC059832]|uniref:transposase n=1 Tax=Streptomyces sp. NPDC059832 TaxID=3346966 RepID=UPI0036674304
MLAEIGDDRERFADARAMKAYAGAAPVTRSSGRSHVVVARTVKKPAAGLSRAHVGLRSPTHTGSTRPLRPTAHWWRAPYGSSQKPVQQTARLPPPLPTTPHAIRPRSCLHSTPGARSLSA